MASIPSKGKWIPGFRERYVCNEYSCDACDRQFSKKSYLEKHLTTELHFKRCSMMLAAAASKVDGPDWILETEDEPVIRPRRSLRDKQTRETGYFYYDNSPGKVRKTKEVTHTRCPTCYAKVDKKQMGKHLISHFHSKFQKCKNARLMNPERNLILEHMPEIVLQSPYQCMASQCKFYFNQKENLLVHLREKHLHSHDSSSQECLSSAQSVAWNCSACSNNQFSPNMVMLLKHLESSGHKKVESAIGRSIPIIVRQVILTSCEKCTKKFLLNRELISHVKATHDSKNSNMVNQLPLSVETKRSDWYDHRGKSVQITQRESLAEKSQKSTTFSSRSIGKGPRRKQKKPGGENTKKNASNTLSYTKSVPSVNAGKTRVTYQCPVCEYVTHKKSHFIRHTVIHDRWPRVKEFHCSYCDRSFYDKYSLTFHKKVHEGKTVKCTFPSCTFVGKSQGEVNSHAIMHNTQDKFACNLCQYSTYSKRHLARHNLLVHHAGKGSSERNQKCSECSFETNTANGLKRHLLQHTSEFPYHCPYCELSTRNIENLRLHVLKRQIHIGKYLYRCNLCSNDDSIRKKSSFQTNKFIEFKRHVTQQHCCDPNSKTQDGLFIIAGIKRSSPKRIHEVQLKTLKNSSSRTGIDADDERLTDDSESLS